MSGRPVKRKGDTNSALIHQLLAEIHDAPSDVAYASSWDGVTTIAPSKNTIWDKLDGDVIPTNITAFDGFTEFFGYYFVLNTDADARLTAIFRCPETRTDWKMTVVFFNDRGAAMTGSGKLSMGASAAGEAFSANNLFNAVNFDLTVADGNITYKTHTAFSATKDDIIRFQWQKDANEGANFLYIIGLWLHHD